MPAQEKDAATLRDEWAGRAAGWVRFARTPGRDVWFDPVLLPTLLELLPSPGRLRVPCFVAVRARKP
jgi:hypothetical protein